ncbi:MAG: AIR synthase family protein [Candidatus Acetothermia bacterium]
MIGKIPPEQLEDYVFSRTGAPGNQLLMGPAYGEDTAAIDLGNQILVINSDPIVFAADRIGDLGVNIASNDVAASGAQPRWLTVTLFVPNGSERMLDKITSQIHQVALELNISVVGGHSEVVSFLDRPFLCLSCLGTTDSYISSGGSEIGDVIILTKGAGIEGAGIIATDFKEKLREHLDQAVISKAEKNLEQLSVLKEARILSEVATAMHDPTEGGVIDGLFEMAAASGNHFEVNQEEIPVSEETRQVCGVMEVDPLKTFGSGALLATVPEAHSEDALIALANQEIPARVIGRVKSSSSSKLTINGITYSKPVRDELYRIWT